MISWLTGMIVQAAIDGAGMIIENLPILLAGILAMPLIFTKQFIKKIRGKKTRKRRIK